MNVLGIETSCDETGVAVYSGEKGLLGHQVFSQVDLHAEYGGVVPELASRDHVRRLAPMVRSLLKELALTPAEIGGVAYTAGPGLAGALLVGASLGRTLAWAWDVPALAVHHMEGHLLAPLLNDPQNDAAFVALLVSGGHTQLVEVEKVGKYQLLGESLDDAVGEAFDKTAKLLGLGYPGGPELARLAEQGDPSCFNFPRPMVNRPGLDFSFSGLKTFALTTLAESSGSAQDKADIARAFEDAVVDTLVIKCRRAIAQTGLKQLVMAGGVSANQRLRTALQKLADELSIDVLYPPAALCTDNGAMIAFAGYLRLAAGEHQNTSIQIRPRWPMAELPPISI